MEKTARDPGDKPVAKDADIDALFANMDKERKERRAKGKLPSVYVPFQQERKITLDDLDDKFSELRLPHAKLRMGDNLRIYDLLTLDLWELADAAAARKAKGEDVVRNCDVAMRSMLYEPQKERTPKRPAKLMMTLIDDGLFSCHIHTGAYYSDEYGGVLTASMLIRRIGKDQAAVGTLVMRVIDEDWPPKPPEDPIVIAVPASAAATEKESEPPPPPSSTGVIRNQNKAGANKELLECDAVLANFFFEVRAVSYDVETRAIGL